MNTELPKTELALPVVDNQNEETGGQHEAVVEPRREAVAQPERDAPPVQPAPPASGARRGKSKRGRAPQWPSPRMSEAAWERRRMERLLDKPCLASPRLMQDRNGGRDCVSQMSLYRHRPDVLASALRSMGISDSGDDLPDQERTE